jgi:glycine cleavage system H lipoate-binding protein
MPVDIFATKGTEYLLVVAYFALLIALARFLAPGASPAPARRRALSQPWFRLADGYHFHPGHAWASAEDGDLVTVGLDDFTAQLAGAPDRIELPQPGAQLRQGEAGWTLRLGDRALTMVSPVDGQVVATNPAVLQEPRLATDDPYGRGWLLMVRSPRRRAALRSLLSGELASLWMRNTAEKLRRMTGGAEVGVVMTDGGAPMHGFGRALGPEEWTVAARDFFLAD